MYNDCDEDILEEVLQPEDPFAEAARRKALSERRKHEEERRKRQRQTGPPFSAQQSLANVPHAQPTLPHTPRGSTSAFNGGRTPSLPKPSTALPSSPTNEETRSTPPHPGSAPCTGEVPVDRNGPQLDRSFPPQLIHERHSDTSDDSDQLDEEAETAPLALSAQLDAEQWPQVRARARELRTEKTTRETSPPPGPSNAKRLNIGRLQRRMNRLLTWENFIAFLAVAGRAPFSAEQYDLINGLIKKMNNGKSMPEYKTVRKYMGRNLVSWCFPASKIYHVSEIDKPRGSAGMKMVRTHDGRDVPSRSCVRIVLPSEWAKLDVCTYTFYADEYEHPMRESPEFLNIERTPIVQRRAPFIGQELTFWALFADVPCVTRQGDTVDIPCVGEPKQVEHRREVERDWFASDDRGGTKIRSVFCGSWMIGAIPPLGKPGPGPAPLPHGSHKWTAHERALQCKLSRPSANQNALDAVLETTNAGRAPERRGDSHTSTPTQTHLTNSPNLIQLYPGDHCILLRTQRIDRSLRESGRDFVEHSRTQHCVFIGSLVRQGLGLTAERLVWADVEDKGQGRASVRYVGSSNVIDIPTWVQSPNGTPHDAYDYGHVRNSGFLPDGSRYLIYRFAFYMDGFKQMKSLGDQRSVGGCYILPLGLSCETRRGNSAPRVLTLCPDELEHNDVLTLVLEDISRAAKTGVDGFDPYGRRVRIFLDPVSFYADYPAAVEVADSYGHSGNAYCTHCTVRKRDATFGSKFLSTFMNNCRRIGFMRTDARLTSIRISSFKWDIYNRLGIKSEKQEDALAKPLVHLSDLLRRAAARASDDAEDQLTPLMFDSSLSCAVAPDHMLTGLIKNTLSVAFGNLRNDERRAAIERQIFSSAQQNGLPVTGHILRWDKHGTSNGLNNHTMTTLMCLLLCSAPAFEGEYKATGNRAFLLPRRLQNLAAAIYYWPVRETDGDKSSDMFSIEGRLIYYADVREMTVDYLKHCDEILKHDAKAGAILDKPNAHRAMELAVHTIPTFGHARNCSEMVLESMHQVFKRWLEKNVHDDSHLTAMERALTRDWMGRVFALYKICEQGNSRERACSELGLRRLLLGEEAIFIDERLTGASDLKVAFNSAVISCMEAPVESMMRKCGHLSTPSASTMTWECYSLDRVKDDSVLESCNVFVGCRAILRQLYNLRPGFEHQGVTMYNAARLVHANKFEGKVNAYKYNEIRQNTVISSLGTGSSVVHEPGSNAGTLRLFAVHHIARSPDGLFWVYGREMRRVNDNDLSTYAVRDEASIVVQLGKGVRRAGTFHLCDSRCTTMRNKTCLSHSESVCDGGVYEVWTRKDGFPPYMG